MSDTNPAAAAPYEHSAAFRHEAIKIKDTMLLDRVGKLYAEARGVDVISIALPDAVHGLPKAIAALVKHGPDGPRIEGIRDLFKPFATAPERRQGTAKVTTLESLIALVNRHKDEGSAIFAKTLWPAPSLTAVIDYHALDGAARHGTHRVAYDFPLTPEFQTWMKQDGKPMEQTDFAVFLEDRVADLSAPYDQEKITCEGLFREKMASPSELITLSRGLEIHVGVKIKRQERVQSGERAIQFETTHTGGGGEALHIPGVFMISLKAFIDGEPTRIPAWLRYRLKQGDIIWFYQLYQPDFWLRERVLADIATVTEATELRVFEGTAEG